MEWVKTAKVGDKIICINNGPRITHGGFFESEKPVVGQTYTIADVFVEPEGAVLFELVEIKRHPSAVREWRDRRIGYGAFRFRPVEPRKTDISVFTEMLKIAKEVMPLDAGR